MLCKENENAYPYEDLYALQQILQVLLCVRPVRDKVTAWKTQPWARAATDTQEMANKTHEILPRRLTVQSTVWTLCYSWPGWNPTIRENYCKTPERFQMQVFRKHTQRITSRFKRQEATLPNHKAY